MTVARAASATEKRPHEGPVGRTFCAANVLVVYVVFFTAIPSGLRITALGSLGRPSILWGLGLLVWWALCRLQAHPGDFSPLRQPVRIALGALVVVALVSFAAALLRGQPSDQVSPAVTAMIRLASWSGVVLVALDGVRSRQQARQVVHGLVILGGAVGVLGLAQFATGSSLLDWIAQLPGVTMEDPVQSRGQFTRTAGTAAHPLEYTAFLAALLPLALTTAVAEGARLPVRRYAWGWWLLAGIIGLSAITTVSRSAIIGLAVAVLASLPALPRAYRWGVLFLGGALAAGFAAVVPGILSTLLGLFTGIAADPSAQSRTNGLERVPDFMAPSPLVGLGPGTFLPRYYIFDNQWVLLAIELGVLGVLAFLVLCLAAIKSALGAARVSPLAVTVTMSQALAASVFTTMILLLFFDGLAFRMVPGILFLTIGLAGAARRIALAERASEGIAAPPVPRP